ncbi:MULTISPECIES: NAD(P)H-dependent oxidoreductase [Streptomyces]|nr:MULTISPECIES: NAD(P)H-dependent oxidoreductase [Streptomyces]UBI41226.1 NAD(P)H-dependent oxidoreductase [Streptomyces mobaraensis]UKW33723.1 NAD(P)H-dependent oxidoreductase [Streptomyces sp. TYQ1024]
MRCESAAPLKGFSVRVVALLAHPRPGSFNHVLFGAVTDELRARGCEVLAHDLCAEGFDPVLRADETGTVAGAGAADDVLVARYREELARADALVFVHPNWWGMPPAVLAGWVQRVLAPGVAYKLEHADGEPEGLLRAGRALVLNTSDTPEAREREEFGDPLSGSGPLAYCPTSVSPTYGGGSSGRSPTPRRRSARHGSRRRGRRPPPSWADGGRLRWSPVPPGTIRSRSADAPEGVHDGGRTAGRLPVLQDHR